MHQVYKPGTAPKKYNFEEYCPWCDEGIPVVIDDVDFEHYEFKCPVCGHKLMLCTLCHWDQEDGDGTHGCDWDKKSDTCMRCKNRR